MVTDSAGASHATYHLADYQGCAHPDPDHSYTGGRVEYDNGACDGWLRAGQNDTYAIGYYTAADQAFYARAAPYWTAFDNYFSATVTLGVADRHRNTIYGVISPVSTFLTGCPSGELAPC